MTIGETDNIAPPIASCLGDLVTLCLLGLVSMVLIKFIGTPIPIILTILIALSSIACGIATYRNLTVRHLLMEGWTPLFGAMIISNGTGMILDMFVGRYEGFGLLSVVINGQCPY